MTVASILWRRCDTPGHDACRLVRSPGSWRLEGTAVFRHHGCAARLSYRVGCDRRWQTRDGQVEGWIGAEATELSITRTDAGLWSLNGVVMPAAGNGLDLDFGFTPATNLLQIRRLDLSVGQAAEAPAAWLDLSTGTLDLLPQRYERRTEDTYWYQAPSVGYAALLEVAASGFVRCYPGLWEIEA